MVEKKDQFSVEVQFENHNLIKVLPLLTCTSTFTRSKPTDRGSGFSAGIKCLNLNFDTEVYHETLEASLRCR